MDAQQQQKNGIRLQLVPAKPGDGNSSSGQVIANLVVVSEGANGELRDDDTLLPYIDEAIVTAVKTGALQGAKAQESAPPVRFFAVGKSTQEVLCPLCRQQAQASVMRGCGLKDATCCLSVLSCLYPIFWLCCLFTCCNCHNSGWYTKGLYCSRCGGKLGKLKKRQ